MSQLDFISELDNSLGGIRAILFPVPNPPKESYLGFDSYEECRRYWCGYTPRQRTAYEEWELDILWGRIQRPKQLNFLAVLDASLEE